jgi:Cytochrome c
MTKTTLTRKAALGVAVVSLAVSAANAPATQAAPRPAATGSGNPERGSYLVRIMGCNHCHTPLKLGPNGPEPDMSRALTGHPADLVMPEPPALDGTWGWLGAGTNTAFAGPWGVSFAANLTPDVETGLGRWTVETFIATMRTGRHEGKGRPVLPPMPAENLAALSESDIRDLFAYLQSLAPVHNRVPGPLDPPEAVH